MIRVLVKRKCDEFGVCEYAEISLARAARLIDRLRLEDVYILVGGQEKLKTRRSFWPNV
ncbi:MAG: hypothetical protein JZD41_06725 [Thermoproteus sp.]|nr:hypothetical protein [Thermoproteus sp.]